MDTGVKHLSVHIYLVTSVYQVLQSTWFAYWSVADSTVKAIFIEGFTETVHWSLFSDNGFTENAEAIFYFQWSVHWNYEHWDVFSV